MLSHAIAFRLGGSADVLHLPMEAFVCTMPSEIKHDADTTDTQVDIARGKGGLGRNGGRCVSFEWRHAELPRARPMA